MHSITVKCGSEDRTEYIVLTNCLYLPVEKVVAGALAVKAVGDGGLICFLEPGVILEEVLYRLGADFDGLGKGVAWR